VLVAGSFTARAGEEHAARLQFEHERLRAEASHLEQRLAEYQQGAESAGHVEVTSVEEGPPRLFETPMAPNKGPETALIGRAAELESISSSAEGEPLLTSLRQGCKKGEPLSINDLCLLVAELHRANSALEHRLKNRPATFDGIEDDMLGVDEESGLRIRLEPMGPTPDLSDWKQHAQLTVQKVHRHQHVQRLEQQLRVVTRKLLQRPLWLWLFYVQLLFVWLSELRHMLFMSTCAM